ncbi:hypothetical protein EQ832_01570 [Pseudomonas sp. ALS1131]|nr:hypothetical protein [Pseudomonas sp. ALS1131]TRO41730.1 hypothetical protein EQ832_01570 [Pseudomonas sp. ALS1131]
MASSILYAKHRIKLALIALIRFVVSRPKLFVLGMRIVNRIPPLKWFLWRIHASTCNEISRTVPVTSPSRTPPAAKAVYLQLSSTGTGEREV